MKLIGIILGILVYITIAIFPLIIMFILLGHIPEDLKQEVGLRWFIILSISFTSFFNIVKVGPRYYNLFYDWYTSNLKK